MMPIQKVNGQCALGVQLLSDSSREPTERRCPQGIVCFTDSPHHSLKCFFLLAVSLRGDYTFSRFLPAHIIEDLKILAYALHSKMKNHLYSILSYIRADQSSGVLQLFTPDSDVTVFPIDQGYLDRIYERMSRPNDGRFFQIFLSLMLR